MALNVKVSFIGLLDMLKFKKMGAVREKVIQMASDNDIKTEFPINKMAKKLHPDYQELVVDEILYHPGAGAKTIIFTKKDGQNPAYFRAGQYLSLKLKIGNSYVTRPFSISCSPKFTFEGKIRITVKLIEGGFVSDWLYRNIKVGDTVLASDPQGQFYYEPMRDKKNVIAVAGGSGITPFLSMAWAIADGTEDFNLTLLFGSRTAETILFKEEFDKIVDFTNGRIRVVHVLSDVEADGYEHGFLSAEIIKKYAPANEEYSVFVCGPEAMYRFIDGEINKLDIPKRHVRYEIQGVTKEVSKIDDYPGDSSKKFKILVHQAGQEPRQIEALASEPILVAIERAGIKAPSRCRSGECGWCRTHVVKGESFTPSTNDGRRSSDKRTNTIHPCAAFPLSDMEIEVPGEYWGKQ